MSITKGSHANRLLNVMKITKSVVSYGHGHFLVLKVSDVYISPLQDLMDLWQASETALLY